MMTGVPSQAVGPTVEEASTKPRRHTPRRLALIMAIAVVASLGWWSQQRHIGTEGPMRGGPPTAVYQPLVQGQELSVGTAILENRGAAGARIEAVRVLGENEDIRVLGFRMMDSGPQAPLTELSFPPAKAVSVDVGQYVVRPYAEMLPNHDRAVLIVGVTTDPGKRGHLDGLEIVYRVGEDRFRLRLNHRITVCGFAEVWGACEPAPGEDPLSSGQKRA